MLISSYGFGFTGCKLVASWLQVSSLNDSLVTKVGYKEVSITATFSNTEAALTYGSETKIIGAYSTQAGYFFNPYFNSSLGKWKIVGAYFVNATTFRAVNDGNYGVVLRIVE